MSEQVLKRRPQSAHILNGRRNTATLIMSLLWVLASAALAETEYYTWIDENGVTNYSERSPKGYDVEHVQPTHRFGRRLPESSAAPQPQAFPEQTLPGQTTAASAGGQEIDPDAAAADERAAIQAELDKIKADNCRIGKQNLARLESYSRIKIREANGEERFLTDDEKQQRNDEARALIRDNCKPG
ncbi:MAG: DUF4124 domain-containing protein [Proteobacteria bacterium]|nr:DUF4124 domain-containing protein [Pseudomonadota bacterium]MDA1301936.1 DUF4124 domain-containing protein [Pseudomonadota bacterium]